MARLAGFMVNIWKNACLPFHYLWACGYNERMREAGTIQCNYISPQPVFFLAILPGSLFWKDGNIGRRAVQWSKYRQELMSHLGAHIQSHTRPAGRLNGLSRLQHPCGVAFFFLSAFHPSKYISKGKKNVPTQLFVPKTQCEGWICSFFGLIL